MANLATDYVKLTRICEFARRLHQLHRLGDDEAIDREFSAVCRAIWGFTLDDFTDDEGRPLLPLDPCSDALLWHLLRLGAVGAGDTDFDTEV